MKILKSGTSVMRDSLGRILKLQDDNYVEPVPAALQFEIQVDAGQRFTVPTLNSFTYYNSTYSSVSSGTLVYDYNIDWGDGTVATGINTWNSASRNHQYVTGGKYVILITSPTKKMPCFDMSNNTSKTLPEVDASVIRPLITRVISWGDIGLKKINWSGCSALSTLPEQQSKLYTLVTAEQFAYGCSALSAIPYGTFFKSGTNLINISDFSSAFQYCSKLLTVHSSTFQDCLLVRIFFYTFYGCTKITSLPGTLFANCPLVVTYDSTFYNCSGLTSIPSTLFSNNTVVAGVLFNQTFYQCQSIISVPSGLFDNIKINNAAYLFYGCTSIISIPAFLFRYQSLCTTFYSVFNSCSKLQGVPTGCFDLNNPSNVCTNMQNAFTSCGTDASVTTFTIAAGVFDQLTHVTSFAQIFRVCSKLAAIPSGLFTYCTSTQYFSYAFYATGITAIPSGLFNTNIAATDFLGCFAGLKITAIPSNLFSYCTVATNFRNTFANCTQLTSAGLPSGGIFPPSALYFGDIVYPGNYGTFQGCNNVAFTTLPSDLFAGCVNAQQFNATFSSCTNLSAIPLALFSPCTSMNNAGFCFYATKITSVGAIFSSNSLLQNVDSCFAQCTSIASIDANLFNTNSSASNGITSFDSTFNGCNNAGFTTIPAGLFQYSLTAVNFKGTFNGCTKITSIPANLFLGYTGSPLNFITNLQLCFYNLNLVTSIPSGLLTGLSQVSTVAQCFQNMWGLTTVPSNLFIDIGVSRQVTFTNCLATDNTTTHNLWTGAAEALWSKGNSPIGGGPGSGGCFYNRRAISNYASIPAGWK